MNVYASSLEIQIHLCDGNITRFVQCDPKVIQDILDHVHPDRIFSQRYLILAEDYSMTVYPCSAVARVDFVMDGFPEWPFHRNVIDILEITEDEFLTRYDPQIMRTERHLVPGNPTRVYGEIEMLNKERLFREVHLTQPPAKPESTRLPLDYNVFFHQLFTAPSLYCRRRGGGAILVNPDHLVRMTFYPGPADTPRNSWRVCSEYPLWKSA